ncbi:GNAT family N-acetyltransferase [Halobaculum sp. CBA1158]|uniref:GNAT family N-acetyltransferase n=1 Tax=Halobaculum sp. CBA1158 TaxID=2904243 RepID=UPI001F276A21|nr:GNAT family N-acetyltransferase [Halobaculum sp. CBA1158]UIO98741.1 GNAT family N-acetyltransferase [Halobaculum sp. CBA1158]
MEFRLLGWPADDVLVRLDHRAYAYAGKFAMSSTGKAVALEEAGDDDSRRDPDHANHAGDADRAGETDRERVAVDDAETFAIPDDPKQEYVAPAGIVAFSEDRTDPETLWLRYVSVRRERRGEGIGPRLCSFVVDRAAERGYDRVRIAVNNAYSFEALYKVGFAWTGRETGIAELVLERPAAEPAAVDPDAYRAGLATIAARDDVGEDERAFVERKRERGPPAVEDGSRSE